MAPRLPRGTWLRYPRLICPPACLTGCDPRSPGRSAQVLPPRRNAQQSRSRFQAAPRGVQRRICGLPVGSVQWWRECRRTRRLVSAGLPTLEVPVSGFGARPPELVPVLSRGRHRSPRQGACFMELASYLAGERWSAHPACTHSLLAALARDVNDHIGDAGLARLAELVPSVIGLTGDDLHLDVRVALLSARMALPVAAASRQQIMAVSVLACERMLATLDGRPAGSLEEPSRTVLAQVPHAAQWAREFIARGFRDIPLTAQAFRQNSAPFIVHAAVEGIAQAYVPQPGQMLRDLLVGAITECASQV